jgi:hypothetical protein
MDVSPQIVTHATFVNVALTAVTRLTHCPSIHDSDVGGHIARFSRVSGAKVDAGEGRKEDIGPRTGLRQTIALAVGPDNRG